MAKKKQPPSRTCAQCIHEWACQSWSAGIIHNMDASNCEHYESLRDSNAFYLGKLEVLKESSLQLKEWHQISKVMTIEFQAGDVFNSALCQPWMIDVISNKGYEPGDVIHGACVSGLINGGKLCGMYIVDNCTPQDRFVRIFALNGLYVIDSTRQLNLLGWSEYKNRYGYRYIRHRQVKG